MELTIRDQLDVLVEEKYRIFTAALNPGKENILGVRLPLLRKLAKTILKGDYKAYLSQAKDDTMEEVMLQGMVIGGITDPEEKLQFASSFIPKIDCWSVCDCFCSGLKLAGTHPELVWDFIQPYLNSDQEYEIRFGVVMLLYYLTPEYAPKAFTWFDRINHEGYYVKMAIAWIISMYYVKLPDITMEYLQKNSLDNFTYNKALQKILESLRIDSDTKAIIKSMKRR